MDGLSLSQRKVVDDALELLRTHKVDLEVLQELSSQRRNEKEHILPPELKCCTDIEKASYTPPKAVLFTANERYDQLDRVTRVGYASALLEHPEGAVLEYPETGNTKGKSIAHRFTINPKRYVHPKRNIQYSLGGPNGGHANIECKMLLDPVSKKPLNCAKEQYTCCGTKNCEFKFADSAHGDRNEGQASTISLEAFRQPWSANRELFYKTLGFYTALQEHGCFLRFEEPFRLTRNDDSEDPASALPLVERTCEGRPLLRRNEKNKFIIECENRQKDEQSHLYISNLEEYDIEYLSALMLNDWQKIYDIENDAKMKGYGPLVPCNMSFPASAKRQFCSEWHRFPDGKLDRGSLHKDVKCTATFDIYTPYEFSDPNKGEILIVCRNPHSHTAPAPVKTPQIFVDILKKLLCDMTWKLADATPRSILLDSGFMSNLRTLLGWTDVKDPSLANLHASLVNSDHVKRIILELRNTYFRHGTGLSGVQDLYEQHLKLPLKDRYVRLVETITRSDGTTSIIIICMTPAMSSCLMSSTRITIDTSFKRVPKFQEFEMEIWQDNFKRSLVICRAFTTSQSAEAHYQLFKKIFEIAEHDTGKRVSFRHIHGSGIEIWVADSHKGQALGLGKFCQFLCEGLDGYCPIEPHRKLSELDVYDHLMRNYKLCTVHIKRHIHDLRPHVSKEVSEAMLSLSTTERFSDSQLQATYKTIREGGKKPTDWLEDKLVKSKFALPGMYWAASKIPLEIWKAAPSTTNGNEQSHRNINRDGVHLTLLAGVMRGLQYDTRAFNSLRKVHETGVYVRDEVATHHYRIRRAIARKALSQLRMKRYTKTDFMLPSKTKTNVVRTKKCIAKAAKQYRQTKVLGRRLGLAKIELKKLPKSNRRLREEDAVNERAYEGQQDHIDLSFEPESSQHDTINPVEAEAARRFNDFPSVVPSYSTSPIQTNYLSAQTSASAPSGFNAYASTQATPPAQTTIPTHSINPSFAPTPPQTSSAMYISHYHSTQPILVPIPTQYPSALYHPNHAAVDQITATTPFSVEPTTYSMGPSTYQSFPPVPAYPAHAIPGQSTARQTIGAAPSGSTYAVGVDMQANSNRLQIFQYEPGVKQKRGRKKRI